MDPSTLQMYIQALMGGGGLGAAQPGPMPMATGYGATYGMPAQQGGGMLGTNPYASINPTRLPAQSGNPVMANSNVLQQPFQDFGAMRANDGGGGGAEAR